MLLHKQQIIAFRNKSMCQSRLKQIISVI